jgi:hypothetical protein
MHIKTSVDALFATKSGNKKIVIPAIVDKNGDVFIKQTDDILKTLILDQPIINWNDDVSLFTLLVDEFTNTIGNDFVSFPNALTGAIKYHLQFANKEFDKVVNVSMQRPALFLVKKQEFLGHCNELYIMREEDVTYITTTERQTFLRKIV